jgi:Transposase DDE domain
MSFPFNDTATEATWQEVLAWDSWSQEIVPMLPKALEEQAFLRGAISRRSGKIQQVSDLLRGLLAYELCAGSFRSLGVWGALQDGVDMANTSWRDRLRKSGDWLEWLGNELLRPEKHVPLPTLKKAGYGSIELVDASHLKCVGAKGKTWRFHCMYSLCTQQLHQVVISDMKLAESVMNFQLQKGAVYVQDSAYGYRKEVAVIDDAGAYTVNAFYPKTFPLEDGEGNAIDLLAWLKRFRAKPGAIKQLSAFFWQDKKRYAVRIVALRRTPEQKKRDVEKKRKAGSTQRHPQKEALYFANWLLVLTTLPEKDWTAQEILSLYRARWQIEIFFKRLKQLLGKHQLRAKTEKTAKATMASLLVSWVLQQEIAQEMRKILEGMYNDLGEEEEQTKRNEERITYVLNEWIMQQTSMSLFRQYVQGPLRKQDLLERLPQLERHFRDSPRKRTHEWTRAMQSLVDHQDAAMVLKTGKSRKDGSALTATFA